MPEFACPCGASIPVKAQETPGKQACWCSSSCRQRSADARRKSKRDALLAGRVCPTCDGFLPVDIPAHGIYCSAPCKAKARRKPPLGSTVCPCGTEFQMGRKDARFCSRACLSRWFRDDQSRFCSTEGCGRPCRAKGLCSGCYNKGRRAVGLDAQPWNDRRRDAYHRRRALQAGASTGRPVILADIRQRDASRCHLCGKRVGEKAWPHPMSPSLDHVVPLSKGGAHDPDNVKLAHLRCNVEKGADGGNEQLLLIG